MKEELNPERSPPLSALVTIVSTSSPVDINHLDIASIIEYIKRLQAHIIFNDNQSANRMSPKRRQSLHMLIATEIIYKTIRTLLREEQEIDSSLDKDSLIQRLELPVGDDKTLEKVNIEEIKKDLAERLSGFVKLLRLSEQLMTNFRQNELIDRNFTESRRILEEYATASEENARLLTDKIEKLSGDNITLVKKVDEQGQKLDELLKQYNELLKKYQALEERLRSLEASRASGKEITKLTEMIAELEDEMRKIKEKAETADRKAETADRKAETAFLTRGLRKENCAETYFRDNIGKVFRLSMLREEVEIKVEKIWEKIMKAKKGPLTPVKLVELVNRILREFNLDISFGLFKVATDEIYKVFKKLPKDIITKLGMVQRTKDGWHVVIVEEFRLDEKERKVYIHILESNVNGERRITREVLLNEFVIDELGGIILISESSGKEAIEKAGGRELSQKEKKKIEEMGGDTLAINEGGAGNGGGGTADGQGGGTADGPGGGGKPDGGGAGASSALGGPDGADDGLPRNNPVATTLPENNAVITGNNNKGNNGQASSAVTANNILNLKVSSEPYNGINYKGIALSPLINTATGLAPPGKAINPFPASLASRIIVVEPTLTAVSSGINSQPFRTG